MKNIYKELIQSLESNNTVVMKTGLSNIKGNEVCKNLIGLDTDELGKFSDKFKKEFNNIMEKKTLSFFIDEDGSEILLEPFFPEARLIVLGGGNISEHLVELGGKIGFKVTVVDDRLAYANKERFKTADKVICDSFDTVFEKLKINENDYVTIVTRGHKYDKDCLRQALNKKPQYLGMIGSKRRVMGVKKQLIKEGYDSDLLDGVCSPIGFNIGGITPIEIAISIISQIIAKKRLGTTNMVECFNSKRKLDCFDMDMEVLKKLAEEEEEKKAIVTIISTKGSTPRGIGAKMIVWSNGKTLGSIGGGCSEGEVILAARDLIEDGSGYSIMQVDMTGDVAEDEGMVCGGIMNVLIEVY